MHFKITKTYEIVWLSAVLFLFYVIYNTVLGQDLNADLLNYHFSSAYRLLNGKKWLDGAISQRQGWFNPLANLPAYFIIADLSSRLAGVVFAGLPVLSVLPVYAITRNFVLFADTWDDRLVSFACAFVGGTGTIFLLVVGTSFVESWMSGLVLLGAWCALRALTRDSSEANGMLLLSGLSLGAAFGLKSTNLPYVVAGAVALAIAMIAGRRRIAAYFWFVGGGVAGFALAGAWWWYFLYESYGNPTFPLMNNIFGSAWTRPDALLDEVFLPKHWWQLFVDPISLAIGDHSRMLSTLLPNRDPRYLLGLYPALAWLLWKSAISLKKKTSLSITTLYIIIFYLSAYICWFLLFNIDRYAIPLELLTGCVLAVIGADMGWLRTRRSYLLFLLMLAVILADTRPIKTFRVRASSEWFAARIPGAITQPNTLYVMDGLQNIAWIAPFLDQAAPGADFIRVSSNLPVNSDSLLLRGWQDRIRHHSGPIRSLVDFRDIGAASAHFRQFGLTPDLSSCLKVISKSVPIASCRLVRDASASTGLMALPIRLTEPERK